MMEELYNNTATIDRFNIRVYGIAIRSGKVVLLCSEKLKGMEFTKFPGGGLEYGEGIEACLRREFREELETEIESMEHFYTTDFFQRSAFIKTDQLISIYYKVILKDDFTLPDKTTINFYWKPLEALSENDVTFPIDKIVVRKLLGVVSG